MKRLAIALYFGALMLFAPFSPLLAASDSVNVNQGVAGCNNNSICEPSNGEDTLSCPNDCTVIVPPTTGGTTGGSTGASVLLFDVRVDPGIDHATIHFKSRIPVFASLKWGETGEYKSGTIRSTVFVTDHEFALTGLAPGTRYFFLIEVEDREGHLIGTYVGTFVTLSVLEERVIPNPFNVKAKGNSLGIALSWNNPVDRYFDYIRIMRSTDRFRSSPFIGTLVYEGTRGYFFDTDVTIGKTYYYTFFTRETSGDFSSGIGVKILFNPSTSAPLLVPKPQLPEEDSFPHFIVIERGRVISTDEDITEVTPNNPLEIENAPGTFLGFDDLWVEITDPRDGETRAYLFTYDPVRKVYRAIIPPLLHKGDYAVRIYGFNKDHTALLGQGTFRVLTDAFLPGKQASYRETILVSLWLLLFLAFIIWLKRRFQV